MPARGKRLASLEALRASVQPITPCNDSGLSRRLECPPAFATGPRSTLRGFRLRIDLHSSRQASHQTHSRGHLIDFDTYRHALR
jgi:hypothetical protein